MKDIITVDFNKSIRDKLLDLYNEHHSKFKEVKQDCSDVDLNGPFLMSPSEIYERQSNKLLIIGQETYGWSNFIDDLDKQMINYDEFNVGRAYYSSPFWNITRKIEKALGNEAYSCAWTNISKYDVNGKRPVGRYAQSIAGLDNILIDELEILKPKVCLFFTGPAFDDRIKNIFENVTFSKVEKTDERELVQLKHEYLPEFTFRTYHPNYLRRSGKEKTFINKLLFEVNKEYV